jgi:hypothetical protein
LQVSSFQFRVHLYHGGCFFGFRDDRKEIHTMPYWIPLTQFSSFIRLLLPSKPDQSIP